MWCHWCGISYDQSSYTNSNLHVLSFSLTCHPYRMPEEIHFWTSSIRRFSNNNWRRWRWPKKLQLMAFWNQFAAYGVARTLVSRKPSSFIVKSRWCRRSADFFPLLDINVVKRSKYIPGTSELNRWKVAFWRRGCTVRLYETTSSRVGTVQIHLWCTSTSRVCYIYLYLPAFRRTFTWESLLL